MKSSSRTFLLSSLFVLSAGILACPLRADPALQVATNSPGDKPLAAFQVELIDLAFKAASAPPLNPHIKNRSRMQEDVAVTCLALEQPQRAVHCVEAIENWRRGTGYADVSYYFAQRGLKVEAQRYIDLARQVSETAEDESVEGGSAQSWRRDRIKAKIARTYLALGAPEQAAKFENGLAKPEAGTVNTAKAALSDAGAFDAQIKELDAVLLTGEFDQVRSGLDSCAQLFNRYYADIDRRTIVEEKLKGSWNKLPIMVRIDLMFELTGHALDHADQVKALALVNETGLLVESGKWLPEDQIPLVAKLAALRHRAGDGSKARVDLDAALASFDAHREKIADIYRAAILRSVAEAYQSMGETAAARKAYMRALDEGIVNPNARPRAEDLSATCCSMAQHAVEPDAEIWTRVRKICADLKAPW